MEGKKRLKYLFRRGIPSGLDNIELNESNYLTNKSQITITFYVKKNPALQGSRV